MKSIPKVPDIASTVTEKANLYRPLRTVRWEEIVKIPKPGWLVDGVIEQNSMNVLYGPAGTGKSFIALDLALSIAYGRPWNGWDVQQGTVLYVAAEGYQSLARRLTAWATYYNLAPTNNIGFVIEPVDLTGGLKSLDQFMTDCVGEMVGASSEHYIGEEGETATQIVDAPPIKLIIFDTMARCIAGADENDAKDMGRVVQWLDYLRDTKITAIDPAVLVVHHSGKYGTLERGSTVVRGAADTMLHVSKETGGPVIQCTKQKNEEAFAQISLEIVKVPSAQSAVVVRRGKAAVMPVKMPPKNESPAAVAYRRRLLDALLLIATSEGFPEGLRLVDISTVLKTPPGSAFRIRSDLIEQKCLHLDETTNRTFCTVAGLKLLVSDGLLPKSALKDFE